MCNFPTEAVPLPLFSVVNIRRTGHVSGLRYGYGCLVIFRMTQATLQLWLSLEGGLA